MDKTNALKELGLAEKEARVYLAALEIGAAPVQAIARQAEINRTTTYVILKSLEKKGLISTFARGKKSFFAAEDIHELENRFNLAIKTLEEQQRHFQKLLPELKSIDNTSANRPRVRFFEGEEGLRAMQEDALNTTAPEIKEIFPFDKVIKIFPRLYQEYTPRRIRKAIYGRSIMTSRTETKKTKRDRRELSDKLQVPYDKFNFTSDIAVYGPRVALASLRGNLSGVIIESRDIATTLDTLFELAWRGAKKYQSKAK